MNKAVVYHQNRASYSEVLVHFQLCDDAFIPRLSDRVVLTDYTQKIVKRAVRFEAWAEGRLVGMIAVYCNAVEVDTAYITSVSILSEFQGKGIASELLGQICDRMRELGFAAIELEVSEDNLRATNLYRRHGFELRDNRKNSIVMHLNLLKKADHEK
ncbi:GNAT family N-acetyltransferase [Kiloniella laminariae]|uniref:GNAT family N-acetyltransferase n=1 Tax=Kiloniella laminariae TaxID=454162 RepID=A0ABT4LHD1_9PROT|nr:GNAT family N-acetyltransferase [Kiloniella laminariae]MCZ4280505.1 GNAT family N-acetyltransferase [Kiloniella laminariae]